MNFSNILESNPYLSSNSKLYDYVNHDQNDVAKYLKAAEREVKQLIDMWWTDPIELRMSHPEYKEQQTEHNKALLQEQIILAREKQKEAPSYRVMRYEALHGMYHYDLVHKSMRLITRMSRRTGQKILLSGRDAFVMYLLVKRYGARFLYLPTLNRETKPKQKITGRSMFVDTGFVGSIYTYLKMKKLISSRATMFLLSHEDNEHEILVSRLKRDDVLEIEHRTPKIFEANLIADPSGVIPLIHYTAGVLYAYHSNSR